MEEHQNSAANLYGRSEWGECAPFCCLRATPAFFSKFQPIHDGKKTLKRLDILGSQAGQKRSYISDISFYFSTKNVE